MKSRGWIRFGHYAVLALIAVLLMLAATGAAESGQCGDGVYWNLDETGLMTITGNGFITSHTCMGPGVVRIEIGEGVKNIPNYGFSYFGDLCSVSLPNGMLEIGERAFYECKKLEAINFPDSLIKIGSAAFSGCPLKGALVVPPRMSAIESKFFRE